MTVRSPEYAVPNQLPREPGPQRAVWGNRALLTLMLGHFTVDMYVGLLPILYPLLTARFGIDLKTVGLVSLAYSGTASITQPFFGIIADRHGTRFIGAALIWTATIYATIGFAPSFPILLLLAAAAGIGSGVYHPLGALSAKAAISPSQRNTAMSIYVTAGTIGVALGPLIGAVIFTGLGLHGTALMVIPGACTAVWLLYELRSVNARRPIQARMRQASYPPIPILPVLAVIGVMMARNCTMVSMEAFIPSWYKGLGYGPGFYGPLATVVVLASAVGTVGFSTLANRYGRRAIILGTLILTIPAILLFVAFTGPIAFVTGVLVGLLAACTGPLTLVMAQELMAGRAGLASGLIMGLAFVAGAIGVPITGALADAFGIEAALRLQVVVAIVAIGLCIFIPSEARMRKHHQLHGTE